jgi:serine O-acetyltransferase
MINSYSDYKDFINYEKNGEGFLKKYIFKEPTAKFLRLLRKTEYYYTSKGVWCKLLFIYYYILFRRISLKTGISIPRNVCEKGLCLPHFGSIVVNANCRIGKNCMIQNNVNIGANGGSRIAPQIGDNVYIGPGAVIFGEILIADNCYIGANAVVNKSFLEPFSVIVGIPARVVKKETLVWWQKNKLNLEF